MATATRPRPSRRRADASPTPFRLYLVLYRKCPKARWAVTHVHLTRSSAKRLVEYIRQHLDGCDAEAKFVAVNGVLPGDGSAATVSVKGGAA